MIFLPHFEENAYFWDMFGKTLEKGCFSLPPMVSILFSCVLSTPLHSLQTYPQGVGNAASPRRQVTNLTPGFGPGAHLWLNYCSLTNVDIFNDHRHVFLEKIVATNL